jgi:hypothetical protein
MIGICVIQDEAKSCASRHGHPLLFHYDVGHDQTLWVIFIVSVNGIAAGEAGTWLIITKQTSKKTIMLRANGSGLLVSVELSDYRAGDDLRV